MTQFAILCDPMNCIVHRVLQARILEWVAVSFSRGSSQPRDQTQVSYIADICFTRRTTREAQGQALKTEKLPFQKGNLH